MSKTAKYYRWITPDKQVYYISEHVNRKEITIDIPKKGRGKWVNMTIQGDTLKENADKKYEEVYPGVYLLKEYGQDFNMVDYATKLMGDMSKAQSGISPIRQTEISNVDKTTSKECVVKYNNKLLAELQDYFESWDDIAQDPSNAKDLMIDVLDLVKNYVDIYNQYVLERKIHNESAIHQHTLLLYGLIGELEKLSDDLEHDIVAVAECKNTLKSLCQRYSENIKDVSRLVVSEPGSNEEFPLGEYLESLNKESKTKVSEWWRRNSWSHTLGCCLSTTHIINDLVIHIQATSDNAVPEPLKAIEMCGQTIESIKQQLTQKPEVRLEYNSDKGSFVIKIKLKRSKVKVSEGWLDPQVPSNKTPILQRILDELALQADHQRKLYSSPDNKHPYSGSSEGQIRAEAIMWCRNFIKSLMTEYGEK